MYKFSVNGIIITNNDKWIYDWFEYESCCPREVTEHLAAANGDDVEITVNSGGGVIAAGNEIYESIRSYTGKALFKVIYAGSAASVIVEAAESEISPVGLYMIHNAATKAAGDYREMQKTTDLLLKINTTITNAYIEKTGMERKKLFSLMDAETWMTAEEAVEYGFVDRISENMQCQQAQPSQDTQLSSVVGMVTGIPEKVISRMQQLKTAKDEVLLYDGTVTPHFSIHQNKEGETKMKLEELLESNPEAKAEYEAAMEAAVQSAIGAERSRLQKLDDIAASVPKEMLLKAKYEDPINAEQLALQVMTANAQVGNDFFAAQMKGAKQAEEITPAPAKMQQEDDAALAEAIASAANKKRRGHNGKSVK